MKASQSLTAGIVAAAMVGAIGLAYAQTSGTESTPPITPGTTTTTPMPDATTPTSPATTAAPDAGTTTTAPDAGTTTTTPPSDTTTPASPSMPADSSPAMTDSPAAQADRN